MEGIPLSTDNKEQLDVEAVVKHFIDKRASDGTVSAAYALDILDQVAAELESERALVVRLRADLATANARIDILDSQNERLRESVSRIKLERVEKETLQNALAELHDAMLAGYTHVDTDDYDKNLVRWNEMVDRRNNAVEKARAVLVEAGRTDNAAG